ncbi:glycosyltransferase [Planococcus citreus]|uniref:Glycosyltransferase involved in cell wall biosynthesis n=1 Tax=Planococcus citreus TaxID=1373 RepID=A0A497YUL3_9BACL|nr:glycosyltransferase [Planococcus citreus]RLJ90594.1 glycosyltransferase involved in cell wall biosynthesis [Planococcus citreus]
MKKVLLIGESYSGGVKTYIDTIMENSEGIPRVRVFAMVSSVRLDSGESQGEGYFIEDNLSFGKSPWKLIKAVKATHGIVRSEAIDVIHANSTFAGMLMYVYSFYNPKLSFLYTPHGYYSFKKMGRAKKYAVQLIEKRINKVADQVIHVSPREEREALSEKLVDQDKSVVILNGVKPPDRMPGRETQGIFTVVNLARVDDQKNPFDFIDIAREVAGISRDIQFIWAGSGEHLEEARGRVRKYGLEEQVKFIGFTADKDRILRHADLYLSTSHYEGLPFAAVEAMSYKLPLLLTDVIGHTDLMDGSNGLLFKGKGDPALYDFIAQLLGDKEIWQSLSAGSYRVFSERFNTHQMMKRLSEVYGVL